MITPRSNYYTVAQGVLESLGATPTQTNMNLLVAWMGMENGWTSSFPSKNPMNTTLGGAQFPGATNFNSVGVKNYPSWSEGFLATAKTLNNGLYPTLVAGLKNSDANSFFSTQGMQELETWAGGSTSYGSTIHQIYGELVSVPSQYLSASSATQSQSPESILNALTTGATDLGNLLGLNNFASGFKKDPLGTAVVVAVILALVYVGVNDA